MTDYRAKMDDAATELRRQQQVFRDMDEMYLRVFGTEDGRQVLTDLEHYCFVAKTTAEKPTSLAPVDVNAMLLNEGLRRAVLHIRHRIQRAKTPVSEPQTQAISASVERKEPISG